MARQKQAHHQLKERKSGIAPSKRLSSKDPLQVYVAGKLINAVVGHKHLGVWLDSTLNMNEHLRRMLRKVNAEIKLLSRVHRSLTVLLPKLYTLRIFCRQCYAAYFNSYTYMYSYIYIYISSQNFSIQLYQK